MSATTTHELIFCLRPKIGSLPTKIRLVCSGLKWILHSVTHRLKNETKNKQTGTETLTHAPTENAISVKERKQTKYVD